MLYPWQTFLRLADPFIVPENIVLGLVSRSDRPDAMSLAAAYTGLDIEYVDGVRTLDEKALPPGGVDRGLKLRSIYACARMSTSSESKSLLYDPAQLTIRTPVSCR
jgi:hypothetical protein